MNSKTSVSNIMDHHETTTESNEDIKDNPKKNHEKKLDVTDTFEAFTSKISEQSTSNNSTKDGELISPVPGPPYLEKDKLARNIDSNENKLVTENLKGKENFQVKQETVPIDPKLNRFPSGLQNSTSAKTSRTTTATKSPEINQTTNVKVVVRARPFNDLEKVNSEKASLEIISKKQLSVKQGSNSTKQFTFHHVFNNTASQADMFEHCGIKELITQATNGFSCTVFAFGQTGSGKTHTITGPVGKTPDYALADPSDHGLLPRSFCYLFDELESHDVDYVIRASYLEVYNEKVKDLLNPSSAGRSLTVRWSSEVGFFVENLFLAECFDVNDLMTLLEEGLHNRQVGSHAINDHSSRSHCMLTIHIDTEFRNNQKEAGFSIVKHGKISFIDLAGSERVKETKSSGDAFTESQNINKSLLTLGNCISCLGDPKRRTGHIPYRDSKLTKLLADSLGGDGFTLMIACISPSISVVQDTINTLRYANRARNIKNKPVVKMDPREQFIVRLQEDLKMVKAENEYFKELMRLPNSESQLVLLPEDFNGLLSPSEMPTPPRLDSSHDTSDGIETLSALDLSSTSPPSNQLQENKRATTTGAFIGANARLYQMLQEYMIENENLRSENLELHGSRNVIQKERQLLSRDNERLIRKMEELERVIASSPSPQNDTTKALNEDERNDVLVTKRNSEPDLRTKAFASKKHKTLPSLRKTNQNGKQMQDIAKDFEREKNLIQQNRLTKSLENYPIRANGKIEGTKIEPISFSQDTTKGPHVGEKVAWKAAKNRRNRSLHLAGINEANRKREMSGYAAQYSLKRNSKSSMISKTSEITKEKSIIEKELGKEDLPAHDSASGYNKLNVTLHEELETLDNTIKRELLLRGKEHK